MDIDEYIELFEKGQTKPKIPPMDSSEEMKYLKLFQYEKVLKSLNEAISYDSTDIKSLLKRTKCYIGLTRYDEAIADAQKVLNIYPDNLQAIDLKGQAQYLMGDFEGGYLTYFNSWKLQPRNKELRLGKQLCEDAMDRALNPLHRRKFDKRDVVNIYTARKKDDRKFQKRLKVRKSFKEDVKFMEDLLRDKNLASTIHDVCEEVLNFIKDRERFMRVDTPLKKKKQKFQTKEKKTVLDTAGYIRACNAAKRRMEIYLEKGRINDCIAEGLNFLNLIEWVPKGRQIEKMKLKCDAYHLLSLAYKQGENQTLASQYLKQELEIANKFNLAPQLMKAYHQLGERYQFSGNITRAVQCFYRLINVLDPERIDELISEDTLPGEIQQIKEAHQWANNIISTITVSLRESIIAPVVETVNMYSAEQDNLDFVKDMKYSAEYVKESAESVKTGSTEEPNNLIRTKSLQKTEVEDKREADETSISSDVEKKL